MKKLFKLSLIALLCSLAINAKAQLADMTYSIRTGGVYSYENAVGGACWEAGTEDYTAYLDSWDNVNGTWTGTGCQQCSNNGNCGWYAANIGLQTRSNNAYTVIFRIDAWEDDDGACRSRCGYDGSATCCGFLCSTIVTGDDCRRNETNSTNIRESVYPSNGAYSNTTTWGSTGDHIYYFQYTWKYSGTTNALYPDCRTQSTGYSAGAIRSWSVYMVGGRTYRFGTCGTAEDTYLRIFSGDGYTNTANYDDNGPLCGGTAASGDYTAPSTGWYYLELAHFSRSALTTGGTLTYEDITTPPAPPATFGNGVWYTTAYTGGNIDLTGEYSGYYSESNLTYNSLNRWGTNGSPSDASGWQGCYVPVDNHVVVSRRTGFTCGVYQLDMPNHDDDVRVYVNGSQVFTHIGCCDAHTNLWTGYLTSTSTIEVRHLEGGGGSHQSLSVTAVTPALSGGTIAGITNGVTICFNTDPGAFTNTASPSGGTIGVANGSPAAPVYEWQRATNNTFTAGLTVVGGNSLTYDPVADASLIGGTYYFRRKVTDACGTVAYSNTISVIVRPQFTSGTILNTGQTICYGGDPGVIGNSVAASGGDNVITYKWQANGVDIGSSNSSTYDPPAGLTTTTTYTRWAKDGTCNAFTSSSNTWTVTVRPQFTSGVIQSTGEIICYGGNPGVIGNTTLSSGGDNSITYEWRANGTPIGSSNSSTYDPPAGLTATTTYTRWAKDATCNTTFTQSTNSWVVTVRPQFGGGTITSTSQVVCYGTQPADITYSVAPTGGTTPRYQWYRQAGVISCPSGVFNGTGWTAVGTSSTSTPTLTGAVIGNMTATTTFALRVDNAGSPACFDNWAGNCHVVYVSGETAPISGDVLATTTSTRTCVVNDNLWHYFRNNSGQIIAAINSNGQNLGNVTMTVTVETVPHDVSYLSPKHGNGGLGRNGDCLGQPELSMRRWYTITPTNQPAAGNPSSVRLFFTSADYTNYSSEITSWIPYIAPAYGLCYGATASATDLAISKNETVDIAIAGTSLSGGPNSSTQYDLSVPSFSTFRFHTSGGIGQPLPVELVSFTGYNQKDKNVLNWITASELNSNRFEIEKSISGTEGWSYIGQQKAVGGTTLTSYTFYDNQPVVGNNYYRLKIIDDDGTFTYSQTINIPVDMATVNGIIKIFPNPTNGLVQIQLQSTKNVSSTLEISNLLGQKVVSRDIVLSVGVTSVAVDISQLPGGTYIVSFVDALGTRHQEKVIKQ